MDRAVASAARATHVLIEEVLSAALDEASRDAVTSRVYARQSSYGPRGAHFEAGLFPWEERALAVASFPPGARLLLGGAGGGRELAALTARGFEVIAFEPSDLVDAAAELAAPNARVVRASYAELVRAIEAREGPLAPHVDGIEGVVLGWGSLMHVTSDASRERLLRALRTCCPSGAVIASFWTPSADAKRLRRHIRRGLATFGARAEDGVRFAPHAGFYRPLDRDDLEGLARSTGYAIALYDERECGHAVLRPG
jgi:hypothetical protein